MQFTVLRFKARLAQAAAAVTELVALVPVAAVAVLTAAPGFRYRPARTAGCSVPMRIRQPFTFAIAR